MTLYRRHQQFNMLHDHGGITIQYQELVEILQQMRAEHPYLREAMVLANKLTNYATMNGPGTL